MLSGALQKIAHWWVGFELTPGAHLVLLVALGMLLLFAFAVLFLWRTKKFSWGIGKVWESWGPKR